MKNSGRFILSVICMCACLMASATIPTGYYSSLDGKKEGELKTATYNLIHNFTLISSYSALPDYFRKTDVRPGTNLWWDMYSDIPLKTSSFAGLNREHSFPKSWWGGSTEVSAYVDLNHLYPSEAKANSAKNNYPLGMVDRTKKVYFENGVTTVGLPVLGQGGGAAYVFEPDDEYKGDFARTYFYMVTCYQDLTWKYNYMLVQNLYPTLNKWSVDLLLEWHRADPVSQKETDRNEAVYKIQNNRNPFIDLPELAEYIWGEKKGEAFTQGAVVVPPKGDPVLDAPIKDMELQFGQVALGSSATSRLFIAGQFLNGYIEVVTYSGNKEMFTLSTDKIPAEQVCSGAGYWLPITYKPTALGEHTSVLLMSGDFGSRGVTLRGECLADPVLTACKALQPSDITANSYVANWSAPAGEEIDYFIVSRTQYIGTEVQSEELLAESNYLEITGFDQSDRESYAVQSVRLGKRSPMSNVIFIDHSGITGVTTEEPLIINAFEGYIRITCSAPQQNLRIYDAAGRQIIAVDQVQHNDMIALPAGVYLVCTDAHRTPVKAVVR